MPTDTTCHAEDPRMHLVWNFTLANGKLFDELLSYSATKKPTETSKEPQKLLEEEGLVAPLIRYLQEIWILDELCKLFSQKYINQLKCAWNNCQNEKILSVNVLDVTHSMSADN